MMQMHTFTGYFGDGTEKGTEPIQNTQTQPQERIIENVEELATFLQERSVQCTVLDTIMVHDCKVKRGWQVILWATEAWTSTCDTAMAADLRVLTRCNAVLINTTEPDTMLITATTTVKLKDDTHIINLHDFKFRE